MFERLKQAFTDKFGGPDLKTRMGLPGEAKQIAPAKDVGISGVLRDALFGDTPLPALLDHVAPESLERTPWSTFAKAQRAIASGSEQDAVPLLLSVLPGSESRVQLLAWTALRKLGHHPPPELAKQVLGVVVEVPVEDGLDLVAAYPEYSARYYNYSGAGVIWETPDARLNPQIDALLAAGQRVVDAIGPWEGDRPAPPIDGRVRLNMLTPSGLHFGEGPMDIFMRDAMAAPVIQAAFELMKALMEAEQATRGQRQDARTPS